MDPTPYFVDVAFEPATDDWHQTMLDLGYIWCRPCVEYHRGRECAIDEHGVPELDWPAEEEPP